jgi:methylthioribulose-1-phosphate dehydratase
MASARSPHAAAGELAALGRRFDAQGWAAGTSGNFSVVLSRRPLQLAMTRSGAHKGRLRASDILVVDAAGRPVRTRGDARGPAARPSAEAAIHLAIAGLADTGAVLHVHSVWSTIVSDLHVGAGGLAIEGYEMLKGLDGVSTHDHREWVPIVENSQDMGRLAHDIRSCLVEHAGTHAVLIRRHGCYTWGRTLSDAERHVEILEFLFEVIGRGEAAHGSRVHT